MTVGKLRRYLESIEMDDAEVLIAGYDHSFRKAELVAMSKVNQGRAGSNQRGEWWEYHGEEFQLKRTNEEGEQVAVNDVVVAVVIQ